MNTTKRLFLLCICGSIIIITQQQCPDMQYKPHEGPTENHQLPTAAPSAKCNPVEQTDMHITAENHDAKISRIIKVTNKITQKMLAYTKGFMQYTPNFVLTINDMPIEQGEQRQIIIKNNCVAVGYTYNFMNGYKKGSKEIEFRVPVTKDELEIIFSWQDDWHVVILGAQPHRIISEVS